KTFVNSFLDRAEATDKQTVVLHLKRPSAYLFGGQLLGSGTGQPIIPKEMLGPNLDTAVNVGSGPFITDNTRVGVQYVYKHTSAYWRRKQIPPLPYLSEIESTIILDKSAQEAAFYGGPLDYFGASPPHHATARPTRP